MTINAIGVGEKYQIWYAICLTLLMEFKHIFGTTNILLRLLPTLCVIPNKKKIIGFSFYSLTIIKGN